MCGWLRLLLQRRRWQGTRSMPFRLLVPFGLLCALLPLHHGAPGPDGTAPDPAHYRWRGSGSPPFHSWGMGIPDPVPSPFPPSQTTPPTCWDPATGLLAEIRWWLPFSALILVLSSVWFRLVALWHFSYPAPGRESRPCSTTPTTATWRMPFPTTSCDLSPVTGTTPGAGSASGGARGRPGSGSPVLGGRVCWSWWLHDLTGSRKTS